MSKKIVNKGVWGCEWDVAYGKELDNAARWIASELKRRTLCRLIWKEKYLSIRYEYVLPPGGHCHTLTFIIKSPWKTRGRHGNFHNIWFAWNECWLYNKWMMWATRKLWLIIQEAVIKWPHLEDELVQDFAIRDGIVGEEVHNKYWRFK